MTSSLNKKINLSLAIILGLFWLFFVGWSTREQKRFYIEQMRQEAQGIYQYIILAREWISSQGGIYIKENGQYVLVTPSHFTKDLADFAATMDLPFTFKVAVINTKNPAHIPDNFEKKAISFFQEKNAPEYWEYLEDKQLFKYAAPLYFQSVCHICHENIKQIYIPACISVTLPAKPYIEEIKKNSFSLALASVYITALIFAALFFLLRHFVLKPLNLFIKASQKIEKGNLNVRVDLKTGDEWEVLSRCFNDMLDALVKHQESLEEKIEEATRELHLAYEELKKTEKYRSEFFSNITHDLKTPVTAIKGAIDLIARKGEIDERYLEIVKKNIHKLSKMIKDLLDCAKLESGQMEILKKENDLWAVVTDAIFLVGPLAQKKNIQISISSQQETLPLCFDYEKIQQVIVNLLTNAIKFSPPKSKVIVTIQKTKEGAIVGVEDFGPGIPTEEWPKVFQKFYRASEKDREGIGLGLAICKGFIEAHGGKIWIEKPNHQGIVFYFLLPKEGCRDEQTKDPYNRR